jgi:glycerophosphoryl diester phosphodiesterase
MTQIQAHRGLHREVRENTLDAFRAAVALGVDGVELDVRWTGDRHLVVHHDPVVEGMIIAATAAADLPDYVPTLAEALDAMASIVVNVEIKNIRDASEPTYDESGDLTRAVLAALAGRSHCVVSSFDLATCQLVHELDPARSLGWLLWSQDFHEALATAVEAGFGALNVHFKKLPADGIAAAHERGVAVNVWTVNDEATMRDLMAAGVDTLITDDPALALALRG